MLRRPLHLCHKYILYLYLYFAGGVEGVIRTPERPALVPVRYYDGDTISQADLSHVKWMLQKFNLGQDIFLTGVPGPERRRLALSFAQLLGLEVEFVCIHRDTTDADLCQRRELIGGSAIYVDAAPVRATPRVCIRLCVGTVCLCGVW